MSRDPGYVPPTPIKPVPPWRIAYYNWAHVVGVRVNRHATQFWDGFWSASGWAVSIIFWIKFIKWMGWWL